MAPALDGPNRVDAAIPTATFELPPWTRGDDDDDAFVSRPRPRYRRIRRKRDEVAATAMPSVPTTRPTIPSSTTHSMPPSSKMPYPTAGAGNSSGDDSPESGDDSPGSGDSLSGEESLSDEEKEKGQQSTAYSNTLPASTDLPSITAPDAAFTTMTGYSDGVWTTITYAPSLESAVPGDRWGPPPPPPNAAHHRRIEIAFAVLGSIAGVCLLVVAAWMARRRLAKRQRSDQEKDDAASAADAPPPAGNQQPSKITRFLSIVPFLQPKMADSAWASLNERFGSEKPVPAVPAVPPVPRDPPRYSQQSRTPPPQLNLQLNQSRPESGEAQAQAPAVDANGNPKIRLADVDEQGLSATGDTLTTTQQMDPRSQYRPPPVSPTGSSISSAFGNGTFIPPTPRDAPQGLRDTMRSDYFAGALPPQSPLMPPPPVMAAGDGGSVSGSQRDTIYTQSSMSSTPRFRTVSSWVGQQTRRIRREPAADVPEQGYGLMMPDGQEPRRVDEVPPVPSLPPQVQERGV